MRCKLWKIIVVTLAFGLSGINSLYAQTDTLLNGTWGMNVAGIETEITYDNGDYEQSTVLQELMGMTIRVRGTYTTSGDTLTMAPSHVYGGTIGLESRWLTQNELRTGLSRMGMPLPDLDQAFGALFMQNNFTYTIRGNSLSLSQPQVFTRR